MMERLETQAYNIAAKIYNYIMKNYRKQILKLAFQELSSLNYEEEATKFKSINIQEFDKMADNFISGQNNSSKIVLKDPLTYLLMIDYFSSNVEIIRDQKKHSHSLNSLLQDKILIFPTYRKVITKKSNTIEDISSFFQNLIFIEIDNPELEKAEIENYYIDYDDNKINISFVPYPSNFVLKSIEEKTIFAEERDDLDEYDKLFLEFYNNAIKYKPNIIVSPEIVGSKNLDKKIKELMEANPNINAIISPSYHRIKNEKKINVSTILVNTNNRIKRFELLKHNPLTEKDKIVENIDLIDPSFLILHINKIGRIGIFICKDYFSSSSQKIIKLCDIDVILIISYTEKYSNFISKMETNSADKRMAILCNSCNCVLKGNLEGPLLVSNYKKEFSLSKCEKIPIKCQGLCRLNYHCFFMIKLELIKERLYFSAEHILEV